MAKLEAYRQRAGRAACTGPHPRPAAAAGILCIALIGQLLVGAANARSYTRSTGARIGPARPSIAWPAAISPTHAGYIPVNETLGSQLYFAYYEAASSTTRTLDGSTPILLWLQGGPGCASTFGGFYEIGPFSVLNSTHVTANPGSWAAEFGLLLIDQPIGTGYSIAGRDAIPTNEMEVADHLYRGLVGFFDLVPELQQRSLFITGESYGGKYIPSIGHYILQAQQLHQQQQQHRPREGQQQHQQHQPQHHQTNPRPQPPPAAVSLKHHRALPPTTPPPNFRLGGLAIGNGLTSPRKQTAVIADVAFALGLVPEPGRDQLLQQQMLVLRLIDGEQWDEAHRERSKLLQMVVDMTGISTMLDVRRTEDYDAAGSVDAFLNRAWVKHALRADPDVKYVSCSETVDRSMRGDVMRSVEHLLPDILAHVPVLLYQGQFDLQDGPASNEAWVKGLDWPGQQEFNAQNSTLWKVGGVVAGWMREAGGLRQVVVRNAGHMVPHDQPHAAAAMMRKWVAAALARVGSAKGAGS